MAPPIIYFALRYRFDPKRWLRCLAIYTLALATFVSAIQVEAVTRLHTDRYFVAARTAGAEGVPMDSCQS